MRRFCNFLPNSWPPYLLPNEQITVLTTFRRRARTEHFKTEVAYAGLSDVARQRLGKQLSEPKFWHTGEEILSPTQLLCSRSSNSTDDLFRTFKNAFLIAIRSCCFFAKCLLPYANHPFLQKSRLFQDNLQILKFSREYVDLSQVSFGKHERKNERSEINKLDMVGYYSSVPIKLQNKYKWVPIPTYIIFQVNIAICS